ncbi:DUF1881-domain-containing protein [Trichocladium antarcticum]|uniref:DUF1881-domain-containing protein n=1 Tax=Trichocladium antarcticum TaxID=1450529 RepID=A0AAN6UGD7_9PEZI|nr:DUF1881-domain-containing protein [Trichocladium antarcticum]
MGVSPPRQLPNTKLSHLQQQSSSLQTPHPQHTTTTYHHNPSSSPPPAAMSAPPVDPQAALFYEGKNFTGTQHDYKVGDNISVPHELNDKLLSTNIGSLAKVIGWRDYGSGGGGIFQEWTGAQPDITSLGGLSRFLVSPISSRAISFLFKDATGGKDRQYSLKVDARDVGEALLYSNVDDQYRLVGVMPENGPPVTTAVYIRDELSGVYLAVGSIYFEWNAAEDKVDIVQDGNWPKQLKSEQTGKSAFLITLIDNTPST